MSLSPRAAARAPVSKELLASALEHYHETFVVPQIKAQDRAILILGAAVIVLAAAVVYLLVDRVA